MNKQPGMLLERFNEHYEGTSLWDIGKPQERLVREFSQRLPKSPVLEVGCGTGDTTIYLAQAGCEVTGVDFSPKAIEVAQEKAATAGLDANFLVQDVFKLDSLGLQFNAVVDCMYFHLLDDESRSVYETLLSRIVNKGGEVYMLNFSESLPIDDSPRAVTEGIIRSVFAANWSITCLESARVSLSFLDSGWYGTYAVLERNA